MSVSSIVDQIEQARRSLAGATLAELVSGTLPTEASEAAALVLVDMIEQEWLPIDTRTLCDIHEAGVAVWGVTAEDLCRWCALWSRDPRLRLFALGLAVALFGHPQVSWRRDIVARRGGDSLVYDKAGLVTGSGHGELTFTKEGVLVGDHLLHYSPLLLQYHVVPVGAFLDRFLAQARALRAHTTTIGLAIDPDVVLDRALHSTLFTKAFMRGPRGLSVAQLQNPAFPERADGTVTEHVRTQDVSPLDFRDVSKLQVMWSERGGIKSVQIEELVPVDAREFRRKMYVMNRYVHAQWDTKSERIVHFDGAVRIYDKERYAARLAADPRNKQPGARAGAYRKLFRLDAPLPLGEWCQLVSRFYAENELATEYLGGEADIA